jgi:uncharacterized membrane protein YkvA (DUF1232 family)
MACLFPEGLTEKEFSLLTRCSNEVSEFSLTELLKLAEEHLEIVRRAHSKNIFINFKLAKEIFNTFQLVADQWDSNPGHSHPWLKGMIRYFSLSTDLESDLTSPIGFDDDVEIMNACLRLASREDLCLNPEDFDDV